MKLRDYLQDRRAFLLWCVCTFLLAAVALWTLRVRLLTLFVLFFIWFTPLTLYMLQQFLQEKRFLDELSRLSQTMEQTYLLSEVMKAPGYLEGQICYQALQRICRSILKQFNAYQNAQREYREYVETWVHEIKTPIASARLIIENHKDAVTRAINVELGQIDDYVEQALYYAKSSNANEDYQIRRCDLSQLVKDAIMRNASNLIRKSFSVDVSQAEGIVYSDGQWVAFILNQLIGNALKYCREDQRKLTVFTEVKKNCTILAIRDNGIGIPIREQSKVFEKGYTGENGRRFGKSTGIGLYLCKKLCTSLGIGISLESEVGVGTTVRLTFPMGDLNTVVRGSR